MSREQPVISEQARIARNSRVVFRELGGDEGGVLLHLDSGQYHRLNPMGCTIWGLINGARTVPILTEEVRKIVSDAPANLLVEVQEFLEGLHSRNLIEVADA